MGAIQTLGGRLSSKQPFSVDTATGGQIHFLFCEKSGTVLTKLVWGGSQPCPCPMATQDRTGTNPTSLSMSYFIQQYFHAKPWA